MTSKRKHLIIGSGPAALNAVESIRRLNRDDEIKLVSKEGTLPYSPAILPYLLAGRTTESAIWLREEGYFRSARVSFARSKEVVRVVPDKRQVVYRDGDADEYDNLLIASGAEPLPPPVSGLNDNICHNFRNLDDYHRLNSLLKKGLKVAVLGAGMIATELALALVERGNKVQIIGRGRPLRAYFDERPGKHIADILVSHGIDISTGKTIDAVKKSRAGIEVRCAEGDVFKADVLVACLGVRPNLSLLEGSGIAINQGVLVDSRMRTNIDSIYAAGDIAEAPDFFNSRPGISAILPSAIAQGKVAGTNMAGGDSSYEGWLSMNQFKFFGNSAFSIGIAAPQDSKDEILEENNDDKGRFKRLIIRDNRLIGAVFVNVDIDPGTIRYLIEKKVDINSYKEKLFEQPREISRWLMMENERKVTV